MVVDSSLSRCQAIKLTTPLSSRFHILTPPRISHFFFATFTVLFCNAGLTYTGCLEEGDIDAVVCKANCAVGEAEAETTDLAACEAACDGIVPNPPAGAAQVYASVVCVIAAVVASLF